MGIKSDIEDAIRVHGAWKAKFRDFLNGKAGLDLSGVGKTNACKLGMWLDNEAHRMLSPENHEKTCDLHARFHQVAGEIVHNIKQREFMAARESLASEGEFNKASHELCAFLRKVSLHASPASENKAQVIETVGSPTETPQQQG